MRICIAVFKIILGKSSAVTYCQVHFPLIFKDVLHIGVHIPGNAADLVIGSHYSVSAALRESRLERTVIVFVEQLHGNIGISAHTVFFVVIGAEMFKGGESFQQNSAFVCAAVPDILVGRLFTVSSTCKTDGVFL